MNRKGFSQILIGIIIALLVVGLSGYILMKSRQTPVPVPKVQTETPIPTASPMPTSTEDSTSSPTSNLSGKVFYVSDSTNSNKDTTILDFDRGIKYKIGIPYIYRGDSDQFLLVSPNKTKIALLGQGTSTFETAPFKLSDLFVKEARACMPEPIATLYVIDLEKRVKIKLVDNVLFNNYATSSPVQWMDNNSICYQELSLSGSNPCTSTIVHGKTWQVSLDGSKKEIPENQCRPQPQEASITGWKTLKVNENEALIKTDDGIYPLGNRWESTSVVLKNNQNNQQKVLIAGGSQLVTSEAITLAPLKNAFLFETVKEGKTKMEKEGNEEIEIMSLNGEVLLRIAGTYATWIQ
ncbi:MAG: hypothetical protein AAB874_03500 [Patescibacteria group bacterium]